MSVRCHNCRQSFHACQMIPDKHDRIYCYRCWALRDGLIPPSLPLAEMPAGFADRALFAQWLIHQGRLSDELGAGESVDEAKVAAVCAGRGM